MIDALRPRDFRFRSDTVGLLAVLTFLGVFGLTTAVPGSLAEAVDPTVANVWAVTLAVAGGLGLLSCYAPTRWALHAAAVHLGARVALAFACAAYSVSLAGAASMLTGRGVYGVAALFAGITVLNLASALEVGRWVRRRRQLVEQLLTAQDLTS